MRSSRRTRGFTLVELMIVVVIIGVLSVLAVVGFRKNTFAARNAEAVQFLGAVRAAQENYFSAYGQYCGAPQAVNWPAQVPTPATNKLDWGTPPDDNAWRQLGVRSPGRVWFQYRMGAGGAGDAVVPPNAEGCPEGGGSPIENNQRPWFWVQARGDFDGDGKLSVFEVTSEKPDVFIGCENN
ncbi:MAG: type II secretion system protein [Myxococcales bacterium]|nr:type II secretion system protein [Myxococcales bacterium]MCB9537867.1 type II secretion system protein [Myxococcales bacterium]